ncbi:acyl carrier protein phosphodiesterase [Nonlabens sp. SCSIO 43208]|uniref:acyl carrier protein phosphodiesterase n=1 Tax=Nonlabens sp. SCSIO 43208 TaxID=2793009 RepID=UPI002E887D06|nr:acyl carrier protein phosphodiesterase [Bacteroidota bacterium]
MNYLAHIYLSGENTELRIGNFIADSVRGKNFKMFPKEVAAGIILHRHIDTYTDTHPIVKESKSLIREQYGLWSSVIVDLYYDHFLAANWEEFHTTPLEQFSLEFYRDLKEYYPVLPQKVQRFLPIMMEHNWLLQYATIDGISSIFYQMNKRTKGKSKMNFAPIELEEHYDLLKSHFFSFMEELESFTQMKIQEGLITKNRS